MIPYRNNPRRKPKNKNNIITLKEINIIWQMTAVAHTTHNLIKIDSEIIDICVRLPIFKITINAVEVLNDWSSVIVVHAMIAEWAGVCGDCDTTRSSFNSQHNLNQYYRICLKNRMLCLLAYPMFGTNIQFIHIQWSFVVDIASNSGNCSLFFAK